jgi:competence protein ComEC
VVRDDRDREGRARTARPAGALDHAEIERLAELGAALWDALRARLVAERERWVLWIPVLFGSGIGVYFALPSEPAIWLGPAGVGFAVLFAMAGRLAPWALIPALGLALVAGGFWAAQLRTQAVAAPILPEETGAVTVIGGVRAVEPQDRGVRLRLGGLDIPKLAAGDTPARVRVTVANGAPEVEAGDRVRAKAVLRPPPGPVAPGAFDFARYAFFQRIGAVGFVLGGVEQLPNPPEARPWFDIWPTVAAVRHALGTDVRSALDGESGAVAAALMTGERGAVDETTMDALRRSGLAHLLAISGLHVGLIAGLVFFAVRAGLALIPPVALRWPIKKWAALAAMLAAGAYLLLVGATVPTQRAFLMTAVVLLGVALDRNAVTMRLVAWAAFLVLLIRPESLLDVSFQMSFAAVTALVAVYETLRARGVMHAGERGAVARAGLYLGGVALTSVVAAAATGPFAVFHFNRLALYGVAANMLAVPTMAFWVMPWALVAYVLVPLGPGQLALTPMGWGIDAVLWVARTVAAWPGAAPLLPSPPMAGLLVLVAGALWLCLWRTRWRLVGLAPIVVGIATVWLAPRPDVLVSREAKLMAVRGEAGRLWLSSEDAASFSADIWLRRAGQQAAPTFPESGSADGAQLRCDPLSCIYRAGRHTVALVTDGRALTTDCRRATLLVARVPVPRGECAAPLTVIDRFDVWRESGHALYIDGADWTVRTVREVRGERPWVRDPTAELSPTGEGTAGGRATQAPVQ